MSRSAGGSGGAAPVGVVGVGTMGRGIVHNLLTAGMHVVCHDVSPAALEAVDGDGAEAVDSPAAVTERVQLVITMLPTAADVRSAVTGTAGVAEAATADRVWMDASTIDPMTITDLAGVVGKTGMGVLDAGISGSPRMNWESEATLMVGGPREVVQSVEPVLERLCRTLIHTGPLGSAKITKLANNLMGAVSMVALAEAFNFGLRAGVSAEVLHRAMMASWARCANLEHMPPVAELREEQPPDRRFPDFSVDFMIKDLACVMETAAGVEAARTVAAMAHRLFSEASAQGYGNEPIWSVIEAIASPSPRF